MTMGQYWPVSEFTWWEEGPDEWRELVAFANELSARFESLDAPKRYGMGYHRFL